MPTLKEWKADMLISEVMMMTDSSFLNVDRDDLEKIVKHINTLCRLHVEAARRERDNN